MFFSIEKEATLKKVTSFIFNPLVRTGFHLRENNVLLTTDTELNAIAATGSTGLSSPIAATGMLTVLI